MKKCTKCKENKENSQFRRYKNYTSGICISCENKYRKEWRRKKHGEQIPLYERENLIKEGKNRCIKCDSVKPLSEFYKTDRINTGYKNTCKSCIKIRERNSKIKRMYNISIDEYQILLNKQNNKCAICHTEFTNQKQCIDHDHNTEEVRGILCDSCNRGLGLLKDDPIIILRAVRYLKAHVKQGELLEYPEEDNQQPSLGRDSFEGSTTSRRETSLNEESVISTTSALQSEPIEIKSRGLIIYPDGSISGGLKFD